MGSGRLVGEETLLLNGPLSQGCLPLMMGGANLNQVGNKMIPGLQEDSKVGSRGRATLAMGKAQGPARTEGNSNNIKDQMVPGKLLVQSFPLVMNSLRVPLDRQASGLCLAWEKVSDKH